VVAPLINNGIDTDDMQKYISSLLAVSKEDVSAMATKYMDPDKTISLIIGDLSVIEPALLDLNLGEIFVLSEEGKVLRAAAKSP